MYLQLLHHISDWDLPSDIWWRIDCREQNTSFQLWYFSYVISFLMEGPWCHKSICDSNLLWKCDFLLKDFLSAMQLSYSIRKCKLSAICGLQHYFVRLQSLQNSHPQGARWQIHPPQQFASVSASMQFCNIVGVPFIDSTLFISLTELR